jgi:RNA polymerase sigma-70 factor (ECF subfamily)
MAQAAQLISQTSLPGAGAATARITVRPPRADGRGAKRAFGPDRIRLPARQPPQKTQSGQWGEGLEPALETAMVAAMPRLRAFALSLARTHDRADDLVQETLARACQNIRQFTKGTNMVAWLVTILRNEFYSEQRRRRREVEDADGAYAETLVAPAEQLSHPECRALHAALARLPDEMRQPLMLVTISGLSYAEAADACACELGTIKSRINRARTRLAAMLAVETPADFVADPVSQCVAVRVEQGRLRQGA